MNTLEKKMKAFKNLLAPSLAIAALFGATTLAKAGTITINLDNNGTYSDSAGSRFTIGGNITNISSSILDLDTDSVNTSTPSYNAYITVDDGNNDINQTNTFAWNDEGSPLAPGASTGDLGLFTVTIAPGTPTGEAQYTFTIFDLNSNNVPVEDGSATFDINVIPATVTPEPGSLVLLGSGLIAMAGFARRRFLHNEG